MLSSRLVHFAIAALLASVTAITASAQPKYGDLVLSVADGGRFGQGFSAYLDPSNPGVLTTLSSANASSFHNWVRMAPDNKALVVAEILNGGTTISTSLLEVDPLGRRRTITSFAGMSVDGFELDFGDQWATPTRFLGLNPIPNRILQVEHGSGAVSTFTSLTTTAAFLDIAIDRDPGAPRYVVAAGAFQSGPIIIGFDGQGNATTIQSGQGTAYVGAVLHPRSGDYIMCSLANAPTLTTLMRVTKSGAATSLSGALVFNGITRVLQDDTVWACDGGPPFTPGAYKLLQFDLGQNAVVTIIPGGLTGNFFATGIESYGSRPLRCTGTGRPGSDVTVHVSSRHPLTGGANYALAVSLARRPGLKLPNGEWLDLDTADPLFLLTVSNAAPTIFQRFRGTLDASGNATATVDIPATLPASLDLTVFVAGITYSGANIIEATNTHWFTIR